MFWTVENGLRLKVVHAPILVWPFEPRRSVTSVDSGSVYLNPTRDRTPCGRPDVIKDWGQRGLWLCINDSHDTHDCRLKFSGPQRPHTKTISNTRKTVSHNLYGEEEPKLFDFRIGSVSRYAFLRIWSRIHSFRDHYPRKRSPSSTTNVTNAGFSTGDSKVGVESKQTES